MDIIKIFAKNVKKYRKLNNLTQEKLAEQSQLHPTYISNIECCRRSISLENVQKIANALNIEPYLLFIKNEGEDE